MDKQKPVPKKKEQSKYSVIVCETLKGDFKGKELYKLVHGKEGTPSEVQTFINRLNPKRANPGADIIGEIVAHMPNLQEMTLGEFFQIKKKS